MVQIASWRNYLQRYWRRIIASLLMAITGVVLTIALHAAPPTVSLEPEQSATGPAKVLNDDTASQKKFVVFQTTAPAGDGANCNVTGPISGAANWHMIFCDDFNGAALDTTKWQTCNPSFVPGGNTRERGDQYCVTHYNQEKQIFRMTPNPQNAPNPNVVVRDGSLHLIATKEGGTIYSGMVSTGPNIEGYNLPGYKPFGFTYGYVEARGKFVKGHGFWPSFWMRPNDVYGNGGWPNNGEYDIVEVLGGSGVVNNIACTGQGFPWVDTTRIFQTRFDDETGACGDDSNYLVADTSLDYHVYGFEWGAGYLKWYFDGKLFKQVNSSHVKNYPFYITANFSLCGTFSGPCDNSTPFPSDFSVDYMRVFQH